MNVIAAVGMAAVEASAFSVFMVGDSHVCSKIYPETVEEMILDADPEIEFGWWGKIGATFETYNESGEYMSHAYDARPEVLIVHLGTNDSYSRQFSKELFLRHVGEFTDHVESHLPDCRVVFITPFYNKLKDGSVNHNTRHCADALLEFVKERRNTFVVDNNADYGMHFLNHASTLMRHDHVHLTVEGYRELGEQVGEALVDNSELWMIEEPPYLGELTDRND